MEIRWPGNIEQDVMDLQLRTITRTFTSGGCFMEPKSIRVDGIVSDGAGGERAVHLGEINDFVAEGYIQVGYANDYVSRTRVVIGSNGPVAPARKVVGLRLQLTPGDNANTYSCQNQFMLLDELGILLATPDASPQSTPWPGTGEWNLALYQPVSNLMPVPNFPYPSNDFGHLARHLDPDPALRTDLGDLTDGVCYGADYTNENSVSWSQRSDASFEVDLSNAIPFGYSLKLTKFRIKTFARRAGEWSYLQRARIEILRPGGTKWLPLVDTPLQWVGEKPTDHLDAETGACALCANWAWLEADLLGRPLPPAERVRVVITGGGALSTDEIEIFGVPTLLELPFSDPFENFLDGLPGLSAVPLIGWPDLEQGKMPPDSAMDPGGDIEMTLAQDEGEARLVALFNPLDVPVTVTVAVTSPNAGDLEIREGREILASNFKRRFDVAPLVWWQIGKDVHQRSFTVDPRSMKPVLVKRFPPQQGSGQSNGMKTAKITFSGSDGAQITVGLRANVLPIVAGPATSLVGEWTYTAPAANSSVEYDRENAMTDEFSAEAEAMGNSAAMHIMRYFVDADTGITGLTDPDCSSHAEPWKCALDIAFVRDLKRGRNMKYHIVNFYITGPCNQDLGVNHVCSAGNNAYLGRISTSGTSTCDCSTAPVVDMLNHVWQKFYAQKDSGLPASERLRADAELIFHFHDEPDASTFGGSTLSFNQALYYSLVLGRAVKMDDVLGPNVKVFSNPIHLSDLECTAGSRSDPNFVQMAQDYVSAHDGLGDLWEQQKCQSAFEPDWYDDISLLRFA